MPTQYHRKITRSEKKLFVITGLLLMFIPGFGAWWQWMNTVPEVEIPAVQLPSPNAYDFYIKAAAAVIPARPAVDAIDDGREIPKSQWKKVYPTAAKEAWLKKNAVALGLLRQGFSYPCRVVPERQRRQLYSRFSNLRQLGRVLVIESNVHGERGNWHRSAKSALDNFRLGHDMMQGGALREFTVGYAINGMARTRLWEIMPHLNAEESKVAARELEAILQTRVDYSGILRAEKDAGLAGMKEDVSSGAWNYTKEALIEMSANRYERITKHLKIVSTPPRTIFNNYGKYLNSFIEVADKPYVANFTFPAVPPDYVNQVLASLYERSSWNYARDEAGNSLMLVALALQAYHLKHNKYPTELRKLVPAYLKQISTDSFGSGEALHYKIVGAKYSLYSVGPDGVDDGGRPIENSGTSNAERRWLLRDHKSKGDMVAGINY